MTTKKVSNVENILTILVCLMAIILGPVWNGYVLSKLWLWFIVATFGVKPITVPVAIGIATIVAAMTYQYRSGKKDNTEALEKAFECLLVAIMAPLGSLLMGLILKQWM